MEYLNSYTNILISFLILISHANYSYTPALKITVLYYFNASGVTEITVGVMRPKRRRQEGAARRDLPYPGGRSGIGATSRLEMARPAGFEPATS